MAVAAAELVTLEREARSSKLQVVYQLTHSSKNLEQQSTSFGGGTPVVITQPEITDPTPIPAIVPSAPAPVPPLTLPNLDDTSPLNLPLLFEDAANDRQQPDIPDNQDNVFIDIVDDLDMSEERTVMPSAFQGRSEDNGYVILHLHFYRASAH